MNIDRFIYENEYIDYSSEIIHNLVSELYTDAMTDVKKVEVAYEFVRDTIPHSFDCNASIITAKASDVLRYKTGICHAKANLLAALLRSQGIPTGFCFQRITLSKDDSMGYCVHAYNAVYLDGKWRKLDARGNNERIHASFSLNKSVLAYENRKEYDEYFFNGIYAKPQIETMKMLEKASTLQDIMDNIPDMVTQIPDVDEITIKYIERKAIGEALSLAWDVFLEYEAPDYSKDGVEEFYRSIHDDDYLNMLIVYGAYMDENMVGVIATRSKGTHIALFFVNGKYHRQGIGKRLFETAKKDNSSDCMTVNSSPYAVEIYRKLGFRETDVEQVFNGLRFTPMKIYC